MAAQPINQRGLREKINLSALALNTPHAFTLDGDGGFETPGQWGTQYRYMWQGNQISFVDPVVHELIQSAGARDGDKIKFWRLETRNGSRKGPVQMRVELVNTADGDGGPPSDPIPPTAREARAQAAPRPAEPPTAPLVSAPATMPRVEQAPAATASVALPAQTAMLAAALVAAIDAANTAESYGEAHGRRVTFTSEDLRAMGITTYMRLLDRGGRQ